MKFSASKYFVILDGIILCGSAGSFHALFTTLHVNDIYRYLSFSLISIYVLFMVWTDLSLRNNVKRIICAGKVFWCVPLLLMLWGAFSATWSPVPSHSLFAILAMGCTTATGLYFGAKYSVEQLFSLLSVTLTLCMIASLTLVLMLPEIAVMQSPPYDVLHQGRWRGMFSHKNWLGLNAGLCALLVVGAYLVHGYRVKLYSIFAIMLAIQLLYKSESTTSMIALTLCGFVLLVSSGRIGLARRKVLVVALLLLPFMQFVIGEISETQKHSVANDTHGFTRTSTLSGRVPHWTHIIEVIKEKPLTGFGYDAFWRGPDDDTIHEKNQWIAFQAHSGWIELMLDFGVVVGSLAFLWMIWAASRFLRDWVKHGSVQALVMFVLMLYMFILNSTESLLLNHSGLIMLLFVAFCTYGYPKVLVQSENDKYE